MSRTTYQTFFAGLLGALLVGCGGGSSSSGSTNEDDNTSVANLSGRAAVGAPIAGAPVNAQCADGSGFLNSVTSTSSGHFEGQVATTSLPCALRVNGGSAETTLHSYTDVDGNVNITPLTDLIIAVATSASPEAWYEQSDRIQRVQGLDTARADFMAALRSRGFNAPSDDFDPFRTPFVIGDAADQLLDTLTEAVRTMTNVDGYTAFIDLMTSGNLAAIPQAPGTTGTGNGDGSGNNGGSGSGGSAAACFTSLLDTEGNVIEQTQNILNPITGDLTEEVTNRQEVGSLTNFRGNTARVINRTTVSNSIAPLTLYSRTYGRLDDTASIYYHYGSESLDGQNGAVTTTFWTEPPTTSRFDLAPGDSHREVYTSYVSHNGGAPTVESTNDLTTTYYGRETVTVPAGTFETCKFYFEETGSHGGWTAISWVSVGHSANVQGGAITDDGAEMITTQLQSYSINGVQQAP